ncbi:MAG: hypothetical protein M3N22_07280 [Acidobacteriota bacterium]|nr:hypothetical protein [Acidobacteriota bacterium]
MQQIESRLNTPLAEAHRAAGANIGVWFGCSLPDDWGNPQEEQRFANESVALIDKSYRAYLNFTGPDRVRYLNAILTNNIKDLTNGAGVASLLLNAQGRILAELETFASADDLFCVSFEMIRKSLTEVIEKYIIMDDVMLTDETDKLGTLALEGPKAEQIIRELTDCDIGTIPELGWTNVKMIARVTSDLPTTADQTAQAIPCRMVKRSPGGFAGAEFIVERLKLEELWKVLLAAARQKGGGPMGYKALSAQRLVQGTPWFGYDFGDKQIPHEAGLELSHISYTKGCYTGQEIVERVRSRGHVNRRRVQLSFSRDNDRVPAADVSLTANDKAVGFVTRAAKSYFPPAILGMGYVNKENRDVGTKLQWIGGSATVVDLQNRGVSAAEKK